MAVHEYKCPCCSGALAFDSSVQKLKCPFCDTEFEVEAVKAYDEDLKNEGTDNLDWDTNAGTQWTVDEATGLRSYICQSCGGGLYNEQDNYYQGYQQSGYEQRQTPVNIYTNVQTDIPYQYRPLSAWAYFGYSMLFSLPIAGFVLLIVFSFSESNINRRNFARSYFCALLVAGVIFLIALLISLITGGLLFSASSARY